MRFFLRKKKSCSERSLLIFYNKDQRNEIHKELMIKAESVSDLSSKWVP